MITRSDVLNPFLFRRLTWVYGNVTVGHPGEAMVARVMKGLEGKPRLTIRQWGETYRVRCPFCKGEGVSLAVNHRYGQRNELGQIMTFLASCSRNECLARPGKRAALAHMLGACDSTLEDATIRPGRVVPDERGSIELPEPLTRLDRLSERHPARQYLVRLGLDPDRVGRVYRLGFCGKSAESLARGKIIIPVTNRGVIRGWQALLIPPDGADSAGNMTPFTFFNAAGMRASEAVYNTDRARLHETDVIVPTPVDVWRFGGMAMSPVGEVWSERQCRSIAAMFRRKTLVLLADAARLARPSTRKMIEFFRSRIYGSFAVVTLPEPGRSAINRQSLRHLVAEEAGNLGVHVRYKKTL